MSSRSAAPSASILFATSSVRTWKTVGSSSPSGGVPTRWIFRSARRSITVSAANGPSSSPRSTNRSRGVGRAGEVGDVRLVEVGGDRRQVDELDADVLPVHHPRHRLAGRERVRGDLRRRLRQLASAGCSCPRSAPPRKTTCPAPWRGNLVAARSPSSARPCRLDLVGDFADLGLEDRPGPSRWPCAWAGSPTSS